MYIYTLLKKAKRTFIKYFQTTAYSVILQTIVNSNDYSVRTITKSNQCFRAIVFY